MGTLDIRLDSLSAIALATSIPRHRAVTSHHHDIVNDIHHLISTLPITIKFTHVYGHQDASSTVTDIWEVLNIEMDSQAKQIRLATDVQQLRHELPPGSPFFRFSIQDRGVCKSIKKATRIQQQQAAVRRYWQSKWNWSDMDMQDIDWEARAEACKAAKPNVRRFVTQHSTGCSSVGHMLQKTKQGNGQCPFCTQHETEQHVFSCVDIAVAQKRSKALLCLRKCLHRYSTPQNLSAMIIKDILIDQTTSPAEALKVHSLLMGFIPRQWASAYKQADSEYMYSPMHWAAHTITALWDMAKDMWQF